MLVLGRRTYLAIEDEAGEFLAVNPVKPVNHGQTTQHPPAVADVFKLFRSAIQTAIGQLAFAQPGSQAIFVHKI